MAETITTTGQDMPAQAQPGQTAPAAVKRDDVSGPNPLSPPAASGGRRRAGGGRGRESRPPRRERREERTRPEFGSKTIQVRRVARVVAGGRRFNFSALVAVGNGKGAVGVGTGKAADTAAAVEKATRAARKHLITVPLTENHSISHRVEAKYSSASVMMMPAPSKGLIAGSAVRSVLELGGITDINAKILSGSKNKLNIARAAIAALSSLQAPKGKSENPNPKSAASSDVRN